MIRILIVDDQNIVRQGVQALLEHRPKLKVVGTADNGINAIKQVGILLPDIVLVDIEMPGMSGITAAKKICQQYPKTKVLVLSSYENQESVAEALQAGAKGYLPKNTLADNLERAIWLVYQDQSLIDSKLLREILLEASFFQSTTPVEKKSSTPVGKQSLKNTSYELHDNANETLDENSKHLQKSKKGIEISFDGLPLEVNKTALKPTFQQSESEVKKQLNSNREILESNKPLSKLAAKKPLVKQNLTEPKPKQQPKRVISLEPWKHWIWGSIIIFILLIVATTLVLYLNHSESESTSASTPVNVKQPDIKKVAALGRIEPEGKVISLYAPTSLEPVKVEQLLIRTGDRVKKGQIIALLDSLQRQKASLDGAKARFAVAQSRLEKVKVGAKQGTIKARQAAVANLEAELAGEIQSQQAAISRLAAELNNARIEFQRNQQLYNEGGISASEIDSKRLTLSSAKEQLNEAKATLERTQRTLNTQLLEAQAIVEETAEIRPVDIQIASAELKQARAEVARAKADMELAYIRAPVDGVILDIHARPGEILGEKGIAEMGQTKRMIVIAEVYQTDIGQIRLGQTALITSNALSTKLNGAVSEIGLQVSQQDVFSNQPGENLDRRVVEVQISLTPEDSQKVSGLTNLQVETAILLENEAHQHTN